MSEGKTAELSVLSVQMARVERDLEELRQRWETMDERSRATHELLIRLEERDQQDKVERGQLQERLETALAKAEQAKWIGVKANAGAGLGGAAVVAKLVELLTRS